MHCAEPVSALPSKSQDPRPIPPASDPDIEGTAFEWDDRLLPGRPLRFIARGTLRACSWATLAECAVGAFSKCNLEMVETRHPPYSKADRWLLGAHPGVGFIVAEADLQRSRVGILKLSGYRSFVAALSAWTDPALGKHDSDDEQTRHDWIIEVRAGRVYSEDHEGRGAGAVRQFAAVADTEDEFGWIATTIVESVGAVVRP